MRTLTTVAELRAALAPLRQAGDTIGLAPTMGNLHAGHLSLVDHLRAAGATRIVATIFVNPTQFGPSEDFSTYPRSLGADTQAFAARGVDFLFAPPLHEVYPEDGARAVIDVPALSGELCGAFRPGHFAGVATVVAKLFNIACPDLAAFGEKDFQQLVIIRQMAQALNFPPRILAIPTIREADGLALSSRNQYLTHEERRRAPELHAMLAAACEALRDGAAACDVERAGRARLANQGFGVDYVAVRRADDLDPPRPGEISDLIVLAAAHLGRTRLIDNLRVEPPATT